MGNGFVENFPKGESGQGISPASPLTQEIAEPLFDLKVGMEQLARNHTFKCILATLLAMGNFLNGSQVRSRVKTSHGGHPEGSVGSWEVLVGTQWICRRGLLE